MRYFPATILVKCFFLHLKRCDLSTINSLWKPFYAESVQQAAAIRSLRGQLFLLFFLALAQKSLLFRTRRERPIFLDLAKITIVQLGREKSIFLNEFEVTLEPRANTELHAGARETDFSHPCHEQDFPVFFLHQCGKVNFLAGELAEHLSTKKMKGHERLIFKKN